MFQNLEANIIVTRLWAGLLKNFFSISGRGKRFFSSPKLPGQLWDLPTLIQWVVGFCFRGKVARTYRWPLHLVTLQISGTVPPLPHIISWYAHRRLNLIFTYMAQHYVLYHVCYTVMLYLSEETRLFLTDILIPFARFCWLDLFPGGSKTMNTNC
jgi:hypothetical protein